MELTDLPNIGPVLAENLRRSERRSCVPFLTSIPNP